MNLVELNDNRELEINPELYGLKRFKLLVDSRRTKDIHYLMNELLYVYFMCDLRSDYMLYGKDVRHDMIIEELDLPNGWKVDTALEVFMELYAELTETKISSMVKTSYTLVDKVQAYIDKMDLDDVDRTGKPRYSLKDVIDAGNRLAILTNKVEEIEKIHNRQAKEKSNMRGGGDKSAYEDGFNTID